MYVVWVQLIAEEHLREMQAAHEVEKVELRDYYQNAMGALDSNQKLEADQRIKEEENKTLLQSSVRVVAGQLHDIKQSYTDLRCVCEGGSTYVMYVCIYAHIHMCTHAHRVFSTRTPASHKRMGGQTHPPQPAFR